MTGNPREDGDTSEPGRGAPEPTTDVLRRLEERLDRASRAAERLIAQARDEVASAATGGDPTRAGAGTASEEAADAMVGSAEAADTTARSAEATDATAGQADGPSATGRKPPPAGWQAPKAGSEDGVELELLGQLIQSLRDLLPPDLQRRLAEAVRELLLAVRALIDFYLERLERRAAAPTEMKDIPIS